MRTSDTAARTLLCRALLVATLAVPLLSLENRVRLPALWSVPLPREAAIVPTASIAAPSTPFSELNKRVGVMQEAAQVEPWQFRDEDY